MTTKNQNRINQEGQDKNNQLMRETESALAEINIQIGEEYKNDYKSDDNTNSVIVELHAKRDRLIMTLQSLNNSLNRNKGMSVSTDASIVKAGDIVRISELFEGNAEKEINTYKLTNQLYADIFADIPEINVTSPLGYNIMGKKVGTIVNYTVESSKVKTQIEILAINPELTKTR